MPRSRIARELGAGRNTVAKYADMRDMSPEPPLVRRRARPATDGLSRRVDAIPGADLSVPRKQRHAAKGACDRAVDEMGYEGSRSSTGRYVAAWRGEHAQGPRDGLCFVNLSFHKTASVRFTRQREDSSRTSVALAPILSSPTTPRA